MSTLGVAGSRHPHRFPWIHAMNGTRSVIVCRHGSAVLSGASINALSGGNMTPSTKTNTRVHLWFAAVLSMVVAFGAQAQTVGVTVGANQSVTNTATLSANVGIEFTG